MRIADEQGRNHKLFLAHVEEVYGNYEFLVVFLKSYRETINEFIYPPKKDCADITFEDIVGKIQMSPKHRRGVLVFDVDSNEWK